MLRSSLAEIDTDGKIVLLDPLPVYKRSKAVVTVLDETEVSGRPSAALPGNAKDIVAFLKRTPLPSASRPSAAEIEEHVKAERDAWGE